MTPLLIRDMRPARIPGMDRGADLGVKLGANM